MSKQLSAAREVSAPRVVRGVYLYDLDSNTRDVAERLRSLAQAEKVEWQSVPCGMIRMASLRRSQSSGAAGMGCCSTTRIPFNWRRIRSVGSPCSAGYPQLEESELSRTLAASCPTRKIRTRCTAAPQG